MSHSLEGFWMMSVETDSSPGEFMQIDGNRIVHWLIPEVGHKPISMRVFFSPQADNTFTMRYTPSGNTWERELVLQGDSLTIRAEKKSFEFTRVSKD